MARDGSGHDARALAAPAPIPPEELAMVAEVAVAELVPRAERVRRAAEDASRGEALDDYRLQLGLILKAAAALGLHALHAAGTHVLADAAALPSGAEPPPGWADLLVCWTVQLCVYLRNPRDATAAAAIAHATGDAAWSRRFDADVEDFAAALADVAVADGAGDAAPAARKTTVEPADLSLAFAADVLPEVRDSMLLELPGRCQDFTARIDAIVRGGAAEDIDVARRIAHTLKGDSNIVGVRAVATLTHALEDILLALAAAPRVPEPELAATLQQAADGLAEMGDHLLGVGDPPEGTADLLEDVLRWAGRLEGGVSPTAAPAPAPTAKTTPEPAAEPPAAAPAPAVGAGVRVEAERIIGLLRIAGDTVIQTRQMEGRAALFARHLAEIQERQRLFAALVQELQDLVEIRGVGGTRRDDAALDALEMERFSELHTVTQRLVEAAQDTRTSSADVSADLAAVREVLEHQGRLQLGLQEQLLGLRALPFATIAPRLQRVVRQAARTLGKDCELSFDGEQTPLDADRLQQLIEPLAHLLRNAVDHGVERAELRRQAGKPESGRLRLEARAERGLLVLRLHDDGPGLDFDAIRRKALELGLIDAGAVIPEADLARMIFAAGFTTRRSATQVSGRGLGMDIALRRVTELNGTIDVHSRRGEGCTFELRLPLTHLLGQVVGVEAGGAPWAVLLHSVRRIVALQPGQIQLDGARARITLDGEALDLWALDRGALVAPATAPPLALVAPAERGLRSALAIDAVRAAQSVIVQDLGPWVPPLPGVSGATVEADGRVAPVLDLEALLRGSAAESRNVAAARPRQASALVVDDSLSARRSLEELLQDAGFAVRSARDGLDAVTQLRAQSPDVLLVDLEMPRMNGLELTSFVRNTPDIAALPVIMITSRNSARHQQLARDAGVDVLLTKPFSDTELLGLLQRKLKVAA